MIHSIALIVAGALVANASEPVRTKPAKALEPAEIQKLARQAKSGTDHGVVAGHWERRALELETKAAQYERDADELANRKGYNPMRYKWPAMVQGPIDHFRAKAMQARRAANESRDLMAIHRNLADKLSVYGYE
jgi:hypothetical protein